MLDQSWLELPFLGCPPPGIQGPFGTVFTIFCLHYAFLTSLARFPAKWRQLCHSQPIVVIGHHLSFIYTLYMYLCNFLIVLCLGLLSHIPLDAGATSMCICCRQLCAFLTSPILATAMWKIPLPQMSSINWNSNPQICHPSCANRFIHWKPTCTTCNLLLLHSVLCTFPSPHPGGTARALKATRGATSTQFWICTIFASHRFQGPKLPPNVGDVA